MLKAVNPATGETVRKVDTDTSTGVENKLIASQKAFRDWRAKSYSERADLLKAVAKYMRDNVDTLGPVMTEEMGKPKKESVGEVNKSAWCAEHYADHAEGYLEREVIESDASLSYVQHLPLGPILGILPWNAPFWLAFRFAAPSLMAGNTCLMKHDPHVPGCAEAIESCFREVGAPDGLFQALYLKTPDVEDVIRDSRVRGVSFTGSSRGGSKVAAAAGAAIKPAVLELGGSDPSIVLADADLEKAADTLTLSRIINAGQSCIAAKRIIVEGSVYDEMTELMKDRMSKLKVGDPTSEDTDVGPIA
ncbi:MAG: aldehyde dehydrogenase family protein, partial [Henriciella sp.]|uniref:aldehyde dehydrogenase family protein n=1 Tax=Henriciella sp. TaxID=1968823 RepID=UPI003C71ECFF